MTAMSEENRKGPPRGRTALVIMGLAALVFAGSLAIKPAQVIETDPLATAAAPVEEALAAAPPGEAPPPAEVAAAAADGLAQAGEEASAIDWAMIGSAATFVLSGLGAIFGIVFGWRADRRKERLARLRERELELEIARLRAAA